MLIKNNYYKILILIQLIKIIVTSKIILTNIPFIFYFNKYT